MLVLIISILPLTLPRATRPIQLPGSFFFFFKSLMSSAQGGSSCPQLCAGSRSVLSLCRFCARRHYSWRLSEQLFCRVWKTRFHYVIQNLWFLNSFSSLVLGRRGCVRVVPCSWAAQELSLSSPWPTVGFCVNPHQPQQKLLEWGLRDPWI